jgi:short-subunit dehydrogenase
MLALLTGGTGGIGYYMADELLRRGYDVILIARNEGDVSKLIVKYPDRNITFRSFDLSEEEECYRLLRETEKLDIDLFINNAGYGDIGRIDETSLAKEVNMVKLNDIATLILVKTFLIRFLKKGKGRVLMTASAAAFGPAPYMEVYYSTKAFVYWLAHGYYRELKDRKSPVTVSVLCPGPVKTGFEKRANAKFTIGSMKPQRVARIAIKGTLKGKFEIVPGLKMKCAHAFSHLVPKKTISKVLNKSAEINPEKTDK